MTVKEFKKKALRKYYTDYYNVDDAITLVKLCQKESRRVYGIDAFIINDYMTQPSMENSIDLSNEEYWYDKAIAHLNKYKNDIFMFEVVY